jgi:hypothetical protein
MRHLKLLFVVCCTAVWLVASMHCPLEVTGVLPCDYCSTEVSPTRNARTEPSTVAEPKVAQASIQDRTAAIPAIGPGRLCEASLLSQSWRFLMRTAPAPRAPSFSA